LSFSWLVIGTIQREVHCLKTLRRQLHRVQAIAENDLKTWCDAIEPAVRA
jgi:hypothetical protein